MSYPVKEPDGVVYLEQATDATEGESFCYLDPESFEPDHVVVVDTRTGIAYTRGYCEHLHPSELVDL